MTDSNMEVPERTDVSISMDKANVYSLFIAVPIAIFLAGIYILRWGGKNLAAGFDSLLGDILVFLVILFLGILLHELIHGLTWMLFGRKPLSAIKFGFQLNTFTPYAHCTEPMLVNPYRLGAAMPG